MDYRDITFTVVTNNAPAWFTALAYNRWTAISDEAGERLNEVRSPSLPTANNANDLVSPWTGAAMNQALGELLIVANGGDQDGGDNGAYSLILKTDAPKWRRIVTGTPAPPAAQVSVTNPAPAQYSDGRPAAMHTCNTPCFANGKVWFPNQGCYFSPARLTNAIWSFNRYYTDIPTTNSGTPLAWVNNEGPWQSYAAADSTDADQHGWGPSGYDPTTGKVWYVAKGSGYMRWYAVDTTTGAVSSLTNPASPYSGDFGSAWGAMCSDLRKFVVGKPGSSRVLVINPDSPASYTDQATNTAATGVIEATSGAVYHAATQTIYVNKADCSGVIYKLPLTGANAWVWSVVTPATGSVPISKAAGLVGSFSKFNKVDDMGNGESCLVMAVNQDTATYVMRVPAGGL